MGPVVPTCCDTERRLDRVREIGRNGIDYVDCEENRRVLNLYLLQEAPARITPGNVRITGGTRIRHIKVIDLRSGEPGGAIGDARLQVRVDRPGDLSTYRLSLVETDELGFPTNRPMAEFDPLYAAIDFTFHESRTTSIDCQSCVPAATAVPSEPDINYLAKDYSSFRQLILDRMALTMPQWQETDVPDIGIALVEILAYVGDYLSYYQDAVATEAYLNTARKRISVRRHLRLLDYRMHDGCNARAWICLEPQAAGALYTIDPDSIIFVSMDEGLSASEVDKVRLGNATSVVSNQVVVFEPVLTGPLQVRSGHACIAFYSWDNAICRLTRGATSATLRDGWDDSKPPQRHLNLQAGDFLCFEQVLGPATGWAVDADPTQRHVVRLTRVERGEDPLFDPPVPLVKIEWAIEDALPFDMILSVIGPEPDCRLVENITVAHGNVFLVDEGVRVSSEDLGTVPLADASPVCRGIGVVAQGPVTAGPYQPTLTQPGLVSTQPVLPAAAAAGLLDQDPVAARPWIRLQSIPGLPDGSGALFQFSDLLSPDGLIARLLAPADAAGWLLRAQISPDTLRKLSQLGAGKPLPGPLRARMLSDLQGLVRHWNGKVDLLSSGPTDPDFVVEIDDEGNASLRFGDGVMGLAPAAGETFSATYRVGLETTGHVGAESITRVLFRPGGNAPGNLSVRNPLSAEGRVAPQSIDEARTIGPGATSVLARAITADDYATLAERNSRVQRAAAVLLWTGTRYEARVAIDPLGSEAVDERLLRAIRVYLEQFRSIGHDLVVVPAIYVPIDLAVVVQVAKGHSRTYVRKALLAAFSGFFNPDNLTFGVAIEANSLLAVAQGVTGVQSARIERLRRLFEDPGQQAVNGVLAIGPMEVARLDNAPDRPENGRLEIELRGGQ